MKTAEEHVIQAIKFVNMALAVNFDKDPAHDKEDFVDNEVFSFGWTGEKYEFKFARLHAEWLEDPEVDMKVNISISPKASYDMADECFKHLGL